MMNPSATRTAQATNDVDDSLASGLTPSSGSTSNHVQFHFTNGADMIFRTPNKKRLFHYLPQVDILIQ
jgi:hypothetical protein